MCRNLEDPRIRKRVETAMHLATAAGMRTSKVTKAVITAYMEAVLHPESLVRVTVQEDDVIQLFDELSFSDRGRGAIDWTKTVHADHIDGNPLSTTWAVIEFKNGSGIELV